MGGARSVQAQFCKRLPAEEKKRTLSVSVRVPFCSAERHKIKRKSLLQT